MNAGAPRPARQAVVLAVLIGAGYMFPLYLAGALSVPIRTDIGVDRAGFGAAISVFFAVGAALMPFGGHVVDRIGPRPAVRLAVAAATGCLLVVALLGDSWGGLCLGMAIGGLGSAVAAPVGGLLIARAVPAGRRPLAFALERSSIPAATLLAGLAVPTLASVLHWRQVFLIGAGLVVLIVLVPVPRLEGGHAPPAAGASRATRPLRPLTPLLLVTAAFLLCSAAATALSTFLVDFGVSLGMSGGTAGWLLAGTSAATIAVRMSLGLLGTPGPGRITVSVMLLIGSAAFALLLVPVPAVICAAALVAGGAAWGWTGILSLAVVRARPRAPGAATAAVQAGGCVGGIIGPLLMGTLVEHGSYPVAWGVLAGMVAAASAVMLANLRIWRHPVPRSRPPGDPGPEPSTPPAGAPSAG